MSIAIKFRKKPVVIEAVLWDGKLETVVGIEKWSEEKIWHFSSDLTSVYIDTREGIMTASLGDWIIKGIAGEFYPCKPDIFQATYELYVE